MALSNNTFAACIILALHSLLSNRNVLHSAHALQLSMVVNRPSRSLFNFKPPPFAPPMPFGGPRQIPGFPGNAFDLSDSLISHLAEVALKRRLAGHTAVKCDVSCSPTDLLFAGKVGPVTVKGQGWASGRGLTCRAIEATVDTCELDVNGIISKQKLRLTKPATGKASIAFNSADFGNFLTHSFLKPPALLLNGEAPSAIEFLNDDVSIDVKTGTVTFFALTFGRTWKCSLKRGNSREQQAVVTVELVATTGENSAVAVEQGAEQLAECLSNFFSKLVIDLDGTTLSFRDMMVTGSAGRPATLMLSLSIMVRKFPSPGLDF